MTADSITVAVAARDEESHLVQAVSALLTTLKSHFEDYEVLLFDDGSRDRTGAIADELAGRHERIAAIHHTRPHGLGGVVNEGVRRARMTYFMWVDGKGATTAAALDTILAHRRDADMVVAYPTNQHERPWRRRLISRGFVGLLNMAFGLRLRYYTHVLLCRTEVARRVTVHETSTLGLAERLIKLIGTGCSYTEVGVVDRYNDEGRRTKAFSLRNLYGMFCFLVRTTIDLRARPLRHEDPSC